MSVFSTIGLVGRLDNERAAYSLRRIIRFLQDQSIAYVLEQDTAELLADAAVSASAQALAPLEALGESCDLVIVVGGDGSMLGGARALVDHNVPLLGVNRGRLGFLTDVVPEDIEDKLGEVLAGKYVEEPRFLLTGEVYRRGKLMGASDALNDVVLHPGKFIRMLEFEIYIDGHFVTSQRSDGIIISTPTGSTAYALSGGGPILHPELDAIGLVPMNPHTLSSRPMVVTGESLIRVVVGEHNSTNPQVTFDGQIHVMAHPGDEVLIRKKPQHLKLIHPLSHNFYERCRSKLGWGGHLLE
ncbi:NAD(+) kinase [Marinimicrobium sp. ABcell2]|uniref:NAD(+) kinase n=1 Tax=Marinimicrobium sp. ABcell2 TaxID=3069751 RepID=UPI0027AF9278|nr:NAD(+) kinase [Marinimicrobium sp. ABcell2]MDQ2078011.1 NAD(+) kinase [Marinimicrobium sp. ABcell2]